MRRSKRIMDLLSVTCIYLFLILGIAYFRGYDPVIALFKLYIYSIVILTSCIPLFFIGWYIFCILKRQCLLISTSLLMHQGFYEHTEANDADSSWDTFYSDFNDHKDEEILSNS